MKGKVRVAKVMDRASKDVHHVMVIGDEEGQLLTSESFMLKRWKGYSKEVIYSESPKELSGALRLR